jgi:hypothetical protein
MFNNLFNKINLKEEFSKQLSSHLSVENAEKIISKIPFGDKISPEQIQEVISKVQELANNGLGDLNLGDQKNKAEEVLKDFINKFKSN